MRASLDLSSLRHFLAFAENASAGGNESDVDALSLVRDGSYLSLLTEEHGDSASALRALNVLSQTASRLAVAAQEGYKIAKDPLLPGIYRRGIHSLPIEVMMKIFELVYYASKGEEWIWVLEVDRHFRDIALRTPRLWTKVKPFCNPILRVERSKFLGLEIDMGSASRWSRPRLERTLDVLKPHAPRWKSFSIGVGKRGTIDNLDSRGSLCLQYLRDTLQDFVFPKLESLTINYGCDVPIEGHDDGMDIPRTNANDPNASLRSFFRSWDMPALRHVNVAGFIPMLPSPCLGTVTCLQITFNGRKKSYVNIRYHLSTLVNFLRDLRSLKELALHLDSVKGISRSGVQHTELPNLKRLIVFFELSCPEVMDAFLMEVSTPNVTELVVKFEVCAVLAMQVLVSLFPDDEPHWKRLESLSLIFPDEEDHVFRPLNVLSDRFPAVTSMTIKSSFLVNPCAIRQHPFFANTGKKYDECTPPPPLRTLRLLKCGYVDTAWIMKLGHIICAPTFETLEIRDCPNVNADVIRKAMPKGKELIISDYGWDRELRFFGR